jgi:hypothetical protein
MNLGIFEGGKGLKASEGKQESLKLLLKSCHITKLFQDSSNPKLDIQIVFRCLGSREECLD